MAGLPQRLRRSLVGLISEGEDESVRAVNRMRTRLSSLLQVARLENAQLLARVISLSPQAVLNRGYAVLWNADGAVIRDAEAVRADEPLKVRVAHGEFAVRVAGDR